MIFPIYKFEMAVNNGTAARVFPIYGEDLSVEYTQQQNEQFFRPSFNGKLTFQSADFDTINSAAFDAQFNLTVYRSNNAGQTWVSYLVCKFFKTDCEFNIDDKTVSVTPTILDRYEAILAGLDKEFDLIPLAPDISMIKIDKRPIIQVYTAGENSVGCFMANMWWEQECEPEDDDTRLQNYFRFALCKRRLKVHISGTMSPELPADFSGDGFDPSQSDVYIHIEFGGTGAWKFEYIRETDQGLEAITWQIIDIASGKIMWRYTTGMVSPAALSGYNSFPYSVTLTPLATEASGNVTLNLSSVNIYARVITDREIVLNNPTYPIPVDDLVWDNRNYKRVIGFLLGDSLVLSTQTTSTPTQWGLYQPNQYYVKPTSGVEIFPVARTQWAEFSVWMMWPFPTLTHERNFAQEYTLKDAYPLYSVIQRLLAQVAPLLSYGSGAEYSQFLNGTNPLTNLVQILFITPKSNLVTSGYDQPAQKATITLRQVFDMLRDCYRCFWFVDEVNRLRIEHIDYFRRGGAYSGSAVVGVDLTTLLDRRTDKPIAYGQNKMRYDKPSMAARYQFAWMDDVSTVFEGFPIDITSRYVNPDNIEEITIGHFTSDVDYIIANPNAVSKDGFVLLVPVLNASYEWKLPYMDFEYDLMSHITQNAYVTFMYLQRFYRYDMPAKNYTIDGVSYQAYGVKKLKLQEVKFPAYNELDLMQLVKTNIGNGAIEKISINLSSRQATSTLKYDTE